MDILDYQLAVGLTPPGASNDPQDLAEHATSPTTYTWKQDAKTITLALLGFFCLIYGLHVLERVIRG